MTAPMTMDFTGKVALVTGAASGIGREITTTFVRHGAKVLAADIYEDGLKSLQEELGSQCVTALCDVTRESQHQALMATLEESCGSLDVAVNCAGGAPIAPLLEITEKDWSQYVDLNLKSVFLGIKHQGLFFRAQGKGGGIINISSVTASLAAIGFGHYVSAKSGVEHLTRIAAEEFSALGVRVLAVAPGMVATENSRFITANEAILKGYLPNVPAGRVGQTADVANTVLFLASDHASYINGSVIQVDGGHKANGGWYDLANIKSYYQG